MLPDLVSNALLKEVVVLVENVLHHYAGLFGGFGWQSRSLKNLGVYALFSQVLIHSPDGFGNVVILLFDLLENGISRLGDEPPLEWLLLYFGLGLPPELPDTILQPGLNPLPLPQKALVNEVYPCEPFDIHDPLTHLLRFADGFSHQIDELNVLLYLDLNDWLALVMRFCRLRFYPSRASSSSLRYDRLLVFGCVRVLVFDSGLLLSVRTLLWEW